MIQLSNSTTAAELKTLIRVPTASCVTTHAYDRFVRSLTISQRLSCLFLLMNRFD
jgi:phosphoenolpyruvate synthase/pyruvate phosphate dikinase